MTDIVLKVSGGWKEGEREWKHSLLDLQGMMGDFFGRILVEY